MTRSDDSPPEVSNGSILWNIFLACSGLAPVSPRIEGLLSSEASSGLFFPSDTQNITGAGNTSGQLQIHSLDRDW